MYIHEVVGMAQYCRYCQHFVTGNGNYCEIKHTEPTDRQAKAPNKCREFELNPMDAFGENEKGYQPRKSGRRTWQQIEIQELL